MRKLNARYTIREDYTQIYTHEANVCAYSGRDSVETTHLEVSPLLRNNIRSCDHSSIAIPPLYLQLIVLEITTSIAPLLSLLRNEAHA